MTIYQTKLSELEKRTVSFSVAIISQFRPHGKDPLLQPLILQLIRSATSVGANYAEANNASSKSDFRSKIYIAKKEIGETRYWLHVLSEILTGEDLSSLQQEALELNLIFQKIVSSLKMKTGK